MQAERRPLSENAGMRALMPIGRSGLAIAAGYVGLVAIFVFPAAPVAIVLGALAIRDIKANPQRHGMGRAIFAIVVGAIVTVVAAAIIIAGALG